MKTKPSCVIFDVGGVLYNFEKAINNAEKHLGLKQNSFLPVFLDNLEEIEISKKHYTLVIREKLSSFNLSHKAHEAAPLIFNTVNYLEDSLKLVRELYDSGYSLSLMTNAWYGITDEVTSSLREYALFSEVFDSSKIGLRKPDKAFFRHVEKTLNTSKEEIFFIDDNAVNINASKKMRWQCFHYVLGSDKGTSSNNRIREMLL